MELRNDRSKRSAFYLCNPLRSTFSKLPPCLTITTITTFGYDWNTIVAIGTAPTFLVAIEILTFERVAPKWLQFGTLPYAYSVHPRTEVVSANGAVYLLLAQPIGTMLEIKNSPPYVTHHVNVPGYSLISEPKLLSCSNKVFLVDTGIITANIIQMWRFQPDNASEPWLSIQLQAPPFLQPVPRNSLRVLAVRGMGVSLYFVFPGLQIAILLMTQNEWFSLPKVDVAKPSTCSIVVWEEACS
ncbi:hypothetical protein GOP47_0009013 [Adiantum capillus-veneris]|uniref:Uncharacterized protein n=1 Tax=Adiantum capillus-veneris TaxID=13818 RepID=A0A9D4UZM8_ADICA|nr:hypothetical protein GOP47_0009013 [Adiantum capillus-veneris]